MTAPRQDDLAPEDEAWVRQAEDSLPPTDTELRRLAAERLNDGGPGVELIPPTNPKE